MLVPPGGYTAATTPVFAALSAVLCFASGYPVDGLICTVGFGAMLWERYRP